MKQAKDLSKEPPRSPRVRLRNYVILARTIDKCRALLNGTIGEYHFDCPLDNILFGFENLKADDFKNCVASSENDDDIAFWVEESGIRKTDTEIQEWSAMVEGLRPYDDPEKREWFKSVCEPLGVNPATATLFDWLEADDAATFKK